MRSLNMPEKTDANKLRTRKIILAVLIVFFVLGLVAVWYVSYVLKRPKNGVLTLHGWVEGTETTLSSQVIGDIVKLAVDEGYDVKQGDLIAQIDSDQVQARVDGAAAEVEKANERLQMAMNDVSVLESKVQGARISMELTRSQSAAKINEAGATVEATIKGLHQAEYNFEKAKKDYNRFKPLLERKKISAGRMDSVEEIYKVTEAQVERAKKDLERSRATLALANTTRTEIKLRENQLETLKREFLRAKTEVQIARAALESARAQKKEAVATLDNTFIRSPVNGTVIEKFVELGEHVVPGTPAVLIIDLKGLYIKTYVEQIDIGKLKYNDKAKIYVDSFPDRSFKGKVKFIAPRAEFTPRDVQMDEHRSRIVYRVEVEINNPEGLLKPGMPADIELMLSGKQQ
jgi:HlyD family secretion protein